MNVWRHPRPGGVDGRCIGQLDVAVDRRKAKRLAHRIRSWARRHRQPRIVVTSHLRRSADVGRWLSAWGWRHRIDTRLAELHFENWQGRPWNEIAPAALGAWTSNFAVYRPGGGESVNEILARCAAFISEWRRGEPACVVTHAGWISAAVWLQDASTRAPLAGQWPGAVKYGARVALGVDRSSGTAAPRPST